MLQNPRPSPERGHSGLHSHHRASKPSTRHSSMSMSSCCMESRALAKPLWPPSLPDGIPNTTKTRSSFGSMPTIRARSIKVSAGYSFNDLEIPEKEFEKMTQEERISTIAKHITKTARLHLFVFDNIEKEDMKTIEMMLESLPVESNLRIVLTSRDPKLRREVCQAAF